MLALKCPPSPTTEVLRVHAPATHLRHESIYSRLDLSDPYLVGEPEGPISCDLQETSVAVKPTAAKTGRRRKGHRKAHSTGNLVDIGSSSQRHPVPFVRVDPPLAPSKSLTKPPSFRANRDSKAKSNRPAPQPVNLPLSPSPRPHRRSASHTPNPVSRPGPYSSSATHSLLSLRSLPLSFSSSTLLLSPLSAGPAGYAYTPTSSRALGFESFRDDHGVSFISRRSALERVLVRWRLWRDEDAKQKEEVRGEGRGGGQGVWSKLKGNFRRR